MPLKIFFDECCSDRFVEKLRDSFGASHEGLEIVHLSDYFKRGSSDDEWAAVLEGGGWIVISADRGRRTKGTKLPPLCVELEITHILFSPTLVRAGYAAQEQVLVCAWPDIVKLTNLPGGTRLMLGMNKPKPGHPITHILSVKGQAITPWCASKGIAW
jgi:hypothetical protein